MAKEVIIREGETIDYQTMIEDIVGMFLSKNMNYMEYSDLSEQQKDKIGRTSDAKSRSWFVGDADYEIVIRKKRGFVNNTKNNE